VAELRTGTQVSAEHLFLRKNLQYLTLLKSDAAPSQGAETAVEGCTVKPYLTSGL